MDLHTKYSVLLGMLTLDIEHRNKLRQRGLTDEYIDKFNYKSWPMARADIAEKFCKECDPSDVPGFFKNDKGTWRLAGYQGIVIPVRDYNKKIVALKIRADSNLAHGRYLTLSTPQKSKNKTQKTYAHGTPGKIACHYPLLETDSMADQIIITEGELKADVTTVLSGIYSVSLPGVGMWEWGINIVEQLKPKRVLLAFDADKNKMVSSSKPNAEPFVVGKSLSKLYLALKEKNCFVSILDWDVMYGKGIDDVYADGNEKKISSFTEEEAKRFIEKNLENEMPLDWLYVVSVKRFYNLLTGEELDKEQFSDKFAPKCKKGKYADKALKNPGFKRVDGVIFEPEELKLVRRNDQEFLNLWKPSDLQPEPGDATFFENHIHYLLSDEREANILLDFIAYQIQHPGKKVHWAVLLQGKQGIGKSYLKYVMELCLGIDNISTPSNEEVHEIYTDWASHCQLVIIEEVMARGRIDLMNKFKEKITEPYNKIRSMYKPAYRQPNRYNIMMFTNHQDAIILDRDDRRYCVFFSEAERQSDNYYKNLWKRTKENAAHILYYLRTRDISNMNALGDAPMTSAKMSIIENSRTGLEHWITEGVENNAWPFTCDLLNSMHICECAPSYLQKYCTPERVGRLLSSNFRSQRFKIDWFNNSKLRVIAVRNVWKYKNMSPAEMKNYYMQYYNRLPAQQPIQKRFDI